MDLSTPLKSIPRISPRYAKTLEKMKLATVGELLRYFPFRYDDFSKIVSISDDHIGQTVTIEGKIIKAKNFRAWRRKMTITEIVVEDENATPLKSVWFNQPYILESLPPNSTVRLSGKLARDGKIFTMNSPAWEKAARDATNTGRLIPIYSVPAGITPKWIRWQIKTLLPLAKNMPDILPEDIRNKYHLPDIQTALAQIHFPDSENKLLLAQKRFAFQEMFLAQLQSLKIKSEWAGKKSLDIEFDEKLIKTFVKKLPFRLTDAQRKASFEILKDLEKTRPMNRLLNGDVGSGKTVVAAIASLQAISAGYQVAIMAPTEVLARQHFESFCKLFKDYDINIALLTNSYKLTRKGTKSPIGDLVPGAIPRAKLLENIKTGKINLIIGTHALIQKDVHFKNLALVIIDEQHRFGVAQRAALQSETMNIDDGIENISLPESPERDSGKLDSSARRSPLRETPAGINKAIPHLLTMTATPIPRTLAIAFFGSLDLSILDEMPKNRKPIITKVVAPEGQGEAYEFVRSEIKKGRQAFVIFPLITESEKITEVKAATEEHKRLSENVFPEFKLGLMHGKLKAKEKESVMQDFKDRKTQILVSTSVVEVGIDVPNATVMIIENSERFGLSQLHQFRGRVGRGEHQSYCFLFSGGRDAINRVSTPVPKRLKILEKTNDGFKIAEEDLKLRGPGQFFGTLQSGLPDIAMENLNNIKLIKFAREEAAAVLKTDPQLKKHPFLKDALQKFSEHIHLE